MTELQAAWIKSCQARADQYDAEARIFDVPGLPGKPMADSLREQAKSWRRIAAEAEVLFADE